MQFFCQIGRFRVWHDLLYEGDPENSQGNLEYDLQFEGYGKSKAGYFTSSIAPHKLMIQLSWITGPET